MSRLTGVAWIGFTCSDTVSWATERASGL